MGESLETAIDGMEVSAFTVPTTSPEADGTLAWNETTIVIVRVYAAGLSGLGYTYASVSTAVLIDRMLRQVVMNSKAGDVGRTWRAMVKAIRNLGRPGVAS